MSFEIAKLSSSKLALITRIFYTIVLIFFVFLEITKLSSSILALVAKVSYTFVFDFLM